MAKPAEKRTKLSLEEAKKMLPDRTQIHTFRNSAPNVLIGADWPRRSVHAAIKKYGVELSGEQATAMKHGLVLIDDHGPLFIETLEQKP